jgi:hypothetical protein
MKAAIVTLLIMGSFVGCVILLGNCLGRSRTDDKTNGMLEQCQRDFDVLLERCSGYGTD